MANIDPYLEAIDKAVYGEEVRGSIRNAINAINVESEKTSDSLSTTIAEAYDSTSFYEVGDACTHKEDDGYTYLYECIANTTGEWDSNDWNQTTVIGWFGGYVASDNVKVYNFPTGTAPGSGIPPYSALSSLLTNYPNNLTIILHDTTANCYYFLDTFTSASISFRFLDVVNRISKLIVVAPNQLQPTFKSDHCLLPSASASDSGKALVVNSSGEWEAQTLSTPSGIYIYDFSSEGITESAPQIVDYDSDINYTNLSQLLAAHTNNVILHDTYGNNYFFVESLTTGSVTFRFWDWPQKTTRQIVVPNGQSSPLYLKGGNALIPNFSFVTDAGKVLTVDGVSGNAIWQTPSGASFTPLTVNIKRTTMVWNNSYTFNGYAFLDFCFTKNTSTESNSVVGDWDDLPKIANTAGGSLVDLTAYEVSGTTTQDIRGVAAYNGASAASLIAGNIALPAGTWHVSGSYKLATS